MSKTMPQTTAKNLSQAELEKKITLLKEELKEVQHQLRLGTNQNYRKIPMLKKNIARIFTQINQIKEMDNKEEKK